MKPAIEKRFEEYFKLLYFFQLCFDSHIFIQLETCFLSGCIVEAM